MLSCLLFLGFHCQVSGQNICSTGHSTSVCPGHSQLWAKLKVCMASHRELSSSLLLLPSSLDSLFLSSGQKIRFFSEFMITTRLPSDQSWDMEGRKMRNLPLNDSFFKFCLPFSVRLLLPESPIAVTHFVQHFGCNQWER